MKATTTIYICAVWSSYLKAFSYLTFCYAPSVESGLVVIEKREIEFESPATTFLLLKAADSLRARQAEVRAKAEADVTAIEREIQEMLCLEHQS